MKSPSSLTQKGLTLVELIIATVLVSVVMLGIVAINLSLNDSGQGAAQRQVVKSQAQIVMNDYLNDAALAVGSANTNDEAILIGPCTQPGWGTNALDCTVCMHQQNNGTDAWKCYTWNAPGKVANQDYQIYSCSMPYVTGADPRGAVNCQYPALFGVALTSPAAYIGSAHNIWIPAVNSPAFTNTGGKLSFSMAVNHCLDNSVASCQDSGVSADPANNPEVQVSGSVIPMQSSGS